jgi:nucleotide-binding universal stress UspA family protein
VPTRPDLIDHREEPMTTNTSTRRIIVGVDPSANAARAAEWAAQEAADRGGVPLLLVHALNQPHGTSMVDPAASVKAVHDSAAALLAQAAGALRMRFPGLAITTEVSELGAVESLVALSRSAELVVTGTRGHGGFAGMLLGSVSHRTAAHAHCPVIVVREQTSETGRNEIVLGVEPDQDPAPIRFAFATAARLGATVTAIRAWIPQTTYGGYFTMNPAIDEQNEDVDQLLKATREEFPQVQSTTRFVNDNAVPALVDASNGARLVVLGAHHRHGPLSLGAGYVAQGLLAHAHTPVAVIPID